MSEFRRTTQTKKSSAQLSAHENFFLKNTTSGKRLIFNTSRCGIYPIYHQILLSSAQKHHNAEDTAILYNIEAHKTSGRSSGKCKFFFY